MMNRSIAITTNHPKLVIEGVQVNYSATRQHYWYRPNVPTRIAREYAVEAYRVVSNNSSPIGVGVIFYRSEFRPYLAIAAHTKVGTFVKLYDILEYYNGNILGDTSTFVIVKNDIKELLEGIQNTIFPIKTYSHVNFAISDLLYGSSSVYTNINDLELFGKEFTITHRPIATATYNDCREILGYSPIITVNALKRSGIEYDFISIDRQLKKVEKMGLPYFLMKERSLREKCSILRQRFIKEKIKVINPPKTEEEWLAANNFESFHIL